MLAKPIVGPCLVLAALAQVSTAQSLRRVGPGAFATIQAAVDASSNGDVVLVAPGTYDEFEIQGKGISVIGDGGGPVEISRMGNTLAACIRMVPEGERTLLRNLVFKPSLPTVFGEMLIVEDNLGVVVLEEIDIDSILGFKSLIAAVSQDQAMRVTDSASVVLVNSTISGAGGNVSGSGNEIGAHAVSVQGSSLFVHGCDLSAGATQAGGVNGSGAVRVEDANIVLRDCVLVGGSGGGGCSSLFGGICNVVFPAGDGGPGLLASNGASIAAIGTQLMGGAGGLDQLGGAPPGNQGMPFELVGTGNVVETPATTTSLSSTRVARGGSNPMGPEFSLLLRSAPSATSVYFFDFETTPAFVPGLPGFLSFGLGSVALFGATDAFGQFLLELDIPMFPAPFQFLDLNVQGIVLTSSGELEFSNPSIVTVING